MYPHGTRDAWGTFNLLVLFDSILVIWLWGAFSEASVKQGAAELEQRAQMQGERRRKGRGLEIDPPDPIHR